MQTTTEDKKNVGFLILVVIFILIILGSCTNIFGSSVDRFGIESSVNDTIRAGLLNPSGASFSDDANTTINKNSDGSYTVDGYVDDTNAFGAKIRNEYEANATKEGDGYSVDYKLKNAVTGQWQ